MNNAIILLSKYSDMKNIVKTIIWSIALLIPFNIYGDNGNSTGSTTFPFNNLENETPARPHTPSHQQITCTYSEGCLFFNFRYPEGLCTLEVTAFETGEVSTYTFDSENEAAVLVGELNNAHLLITTSFGHSYEGEIY